MRMGVVVVVGWYAGGGLDKDGGGSGMVRERRVGEWNSPTTAQVAPRPQRPKNYFQVHKRAPKKDGTTPPTYDGV